MTDDRDPWLAPRWHTALLLALYVLVAVTGTVLGARGVATSAAPGATSRIVAAYVPLLAWQAMVLVYVGYVGRARGALGALVGRPASVVREVAIGVGAWAAIALAETVRASVSTVSRVPSVDALAPRTLVEGAAWVVVAAGVGFGEEVVFRGYFQRQFTAYASTRRAWLAVIAQGALFGIAHLEQGASTALRIGGYGLALGALVRWRGTLVAAIACHVLADVAGGFSR